MPHIIVKLWPGRSEREKTRLVEEIVKDVVAIHSNSTFEPNAPDGMAQPPVGRL
jgi:hypothetical protein